MGKSSWGKSAGENEDGDSNEKEFGDPVGWGGEHGT